MAEAGDPDLVGGRRPVAVGLDDDGGVVSSSRPKHELQGRTGLDPPADFRRTSERDQCDVRVVDQHVADRGPSAGDHVQVPERETAFLEQHLRQGDGREGRLAGRFEHHRAASSNRGCHLVGDEVQREVEGADGTDDTDRQTEGEAELPLSGAAASSGIISPASLRASTAENWNVPTARSASTRAVRMGLAASSAMIRANSSTRSFSRYAAASRISARRQAGRVGAAFATATGPRDLSRTTGRHPTPAPPR